MTARLPPSPSQPKLSPGRRLAPLKGTFSTGSLIGPLVGCSCASSFRVPLIVLENIQPALCSRFADLALHAKRCAGATEAR